MWRLICGLKNAIIVNVTTAISDRRDLIVPVRWIERLGDGLTFGSIHFAIAPYIYRVVTARTLQTAYGQIGRCHLGEDWCVSSIKQNKA